MRQARLALSVALAPTWHMARAMQRRRATPPCPWTWPGGFAARPGRGLVATKGWDAQTGFGQPRFKGWLKHLGSD